MLQPALKFEFIRNNFLQLEFSYQKDRIVGLCIKVKLGVLVERWLDGLGLGQTWSIFWAGFGSWFNLKTKGKIGLLF